MSRLLQIIATIPLCTFPHQDVSVQTLNSIEEKIRSKEITISKKSNKKKSFTCPKGMANIENKYCIDKWEATVIDKNTLKPASPHYIPSLKGHNNAKWQFNYFSKLLVRGKTYPMPLQGSESSKNFVPMAVSVKGKIPASNVNWPAAKEACDNAGKRLCTQEERYQACVGPKGPKYKVCTGSIKEKMACEKTLKAYPYGRKYKKGACNIGLQNVWPPGVLGRPNNGKMKDPRIGELIGTNNLPMKRKTGSFPQCTNEYDVYDMVGNVHEMAEGGVSKKIEERKKKKKTKATIRVTLAGSHYARSPLESCYESTKGHWFGYYDYSIGFRCCK